MGLAGASREVAAPAVSAVSSEDSAALISVVKRVAAHAPLMRAPRAVSAFVRGVGPAASVEERCDGAVDAGHVTLSNIMRRQTG